MTGAVVLATEQGLGRLAKSFYDNGLIQKVWIRPHSSRENHLEWYRKEDRVEYLQALLNSGCKTLLFFETPFDWALIPMARERGIRTVLMPMYECTPFPFPYEPDLILCPSRLDLRFYTEMGKNCTYLPVPTKVDWNLRTEARVFVHNAGNGGLGGRNGTKELIRAMAFVKSPITLILRSQVPIRNYGVFGAHLDPRIRLIEGTIPNEELWKEGDVFVFPEKFNGLSLPLQEAYASGMLVMAGDRFPMNEWLPREPLIPVSKYEKARIAVEFEQAIYTPEDIAARIDEWYGKDIATFSTRGREWATGNSWENLKEKYIALLE